MATSADQSRFLLFGAAIVGLLALEAVVLPGPVRDTVQANVMRVFADLGGSGAAEIPGVGPRTVELPTEVARRVRAAIKQHDYATADKLMMVALDKDEVDADFLGGIPNLYDSQFESDLDGWVAHDVGAGTPLLVRSQFHYGVAWLRDKDYASDAPSSHAAAFERNLQMADADVTAAMQHGASGPAVFYLRFAIEASKGFSDTAWSAFKEGIEKYPAYYGFYRAALERLEPKWGGSVNAMYDFVDRYAGSAGQYSPLKFLYVSLYGDLVDSAQFACNNQGADDLDACVSGGMRAFLRPELEREVITALGLYDHMDKYEFGAEIEPIVSKILGSCGCEIFGGAILELVANSMHSSAELMDVPGKNNYIVDELVAQSWLQKQHYPNALRKAREALDDIKNSTFPSEAAKDLAVAHVLEKVATAEFGLGDIPASIAAERQAVEIGDVVDAERYVCSESYSIKAYQDAIRACTQAIDFGANALEARFWRGLAYQDSGDIDAAEKDWAIVAATETRYRPDAIIDLEISYSNRGDNHTALDILNKYEFMYDPQRTERDWVAIAFNNRCYSRMQLGQLKEALDDCTQSLKYGSIPDAYDKQLKLMKMLDVSAPTL
jgi:tetratricopeptide (TPR) repeat protein